MMKRYYRHYYRNFSNTFDIFSVLSKAEEKELQNHFFEEDGTESTVERIPLKTALHLCAAERKLRKVNPEAAGYSPTEIIPFEEYLEEEKEVECYE